MNILKTTNRKEKKRKGKLKWSGEEIGNWRGNVLLSFSQCPAVAIQIIFKLVY